MRQSSSSTDELEAFPPPALGQYRVESDGLVHNEAIEINAVHGCNLTCRGCSHQSPLLSPRSIADPAATHRSLSDLATVYRADRVRILGGEPLLHPDLLGLVAAVRESGIAERLRLVTNGVLLDRASPDLWAALDEMYISIYPGYEPSDESLAGWQQLAGEHDVELRTRQYDNFRESYSEQGTTDRDLVRRIYRSCLIAHVWRCHNVVDGVFYKCPQSHFLSAAAGDPAANGIPITRDAEFPDQLLGYLNDMEPLDSCGKCLGAVGKRFPHEQIHRRQWRVPQDRPTEELVDREFLTVLENDDATASNACVTSEVSVA